MSWLRAVCLAAPFVLRNGARSGEAPQHCIVWKCCVLRENDKFNVGACRDMVSVA